MIGIMGLGLVHAMGKVGMIETEAECLLAFLDGLTGTIPTQHDWGGG
jgi:hypothetical protein